MKKRQIPHTYVIIFYIILFCAILTWVIPGGQYTESISPDGERTVVYESVESVPQTWEVLSAFYKGFVDKADIIVFILIIGGAFWIVNDRRLLISEQSVSCEKHAKWKTTLSFVK